MADHKRASDSKLAIRPSPFGPAPVVKGEDPRAYDELLAQVWKDVKPANIIEESWVNDIVDLIWNIERYRRYKKGLIEAAMPRALEEILTPFMNDASRFGTMETYDEEYRKPTPAMELVNEWVRRDPKALEEVDAILASGQLTMDDVRVGAFRIEIDKIGQVDALIASAEARRNAVLREIECQRATFGGAVRRGTEAVEGEYEVLNPKAISSKTKTNH